MSIEVLIPSDYPLLILTILMKFNDVSTVMPFSHHSHSGQFCEGHARNTLEEIVQTAIRQNLHTFAFTEHMPREERDFYPEEIDAGQTTQSLFSIFDAYYIEARRLQRAYEQSLHIFVGLEIDWIRPSSKQFIERLLAEHQFDLFIGSVHHVHAVPIDYDRILYEKARALCGGTDEDIFQAYFDAQLDMLQSLKPPVVGHFDLIRLKSDNPDGSFQRWESVWHKIIRNLEYIAGYGGILELNSAALRKGMSEPYPKSEICKAFLQKGGTFTLSDDSHGIDQVGYGFDKVLIFAEEVGINNLLMLVRGSTTQDARFPGVSSRIVQVGDLTAPQDRIAPTGKKNEPASTI